MNTVHSANDLPSERSKLPARERTAKSEWTDEARLRSFAEELEALQRRTLAKIGQEDIEYIQKLDRFSRTMQIVGRTLIHVSLEPVTFFTGVGMLWVHKQLQATEVGHSALHGAWDRLPGCEKFWSKTFRWDAPVDEDSWRRVHNIMHHGHTNIAGKDPDIHFGPIRFTEQTPHTWRNWIAVPFGAVMIVPNFLFVIGSHVSGLNDVMSDNGLPQKLDVLPNRSTESVRGAWRKALRKYVPYYLREYAFFPALAGPMFWKVALGNFMAETMRSGYTAATIFCGHVGDDVKSWPEGTRPAGRGEWFAMQVESTNDFEVSLPISILCGGLERQIEHHLFPSLPPRRLREIAPEVRAICEKHHVAYKTATWGKTLRKVFAHIVRLSAPVAVPPAGEAGGAAVAGVKAARRQAVAA
jgi:linoleoyl-CoA desaturase